MPVSTLSNLSAHQNLSKQNHFIIAGYGGDRNKVMGRFRDRNYQVIQNELLCFGCDFGRTIKLRTPQSRFLHGRLRLHGLDQVCCEGFTHRLKEMVLRYPILEVPICFQDKGKNLKFARIYLHIHKNSAFI
ncbi:hypothetical protein TNCT_589281 [Trichonephila clavata]|uniref:Uncharacterized protein n=1 Tax=Trichonephila clavata TaxID=2740835 RepID=A0A8X6IJQ6_TRICU|nr:hypothetical protein TNCT_589281 [Trichonephila clavata]